MDEMSIYSRALSARKSPPSTSVSATATNGLTGKFDPSVTPAFGLAEAQVAFGDHHQHDLWREQPMGGQQLHLHGHDQFVPLQITGLEPGILLDSLRRFRGAGDQSLLSAGTVAGRAGRRHRPTATGRCRSGTTAPAPMSPTVATGELAAVTSSSQSNALVCRLAAAADADHDHRAAGTDRSITR